MWSSPTATWSLAIECYCTMVRAMKWSAGPSYQFMKYLALFRPKKTKSVAISPRIHTVRETEEFRQVSPVTVTANLPDPTVGGILTFAHLRKQINGSISRTRRLAQLNFASFDRWAWGAKVDLYLFDINKSGIDWFVLTKWWKRSYLTEQ